MIVNFEDDYGIFFQKEMDVLPNEGHFVNINSDTYRVQKVKWELNQNTVLITVTQKSDKTFESIFKVKEENLKPKLENLENKVKKIEKRNQELEEEVSTIRRHIKTQGKLK